MKTQSKFGRMLVATACGLAALAGVASPAHAVDTTTTFTLTAGGLAITAPASKALGSAATSASVVTAVLLGDVSVADTRGVLLGTWTASVTSSDYTTTGDGAPVIDKANADYWSGASISPTGTAVRLPGQATVANKVTLAESRTAFSASAVVGNGTTTWNPTVSINIPAGAVTGTYTGSITHSVA